MACAGERARLEPGVALPSAALGDEVLLERRERHRERAAVAVRAQAHVDPEHEPVGRDVVQRGDHAPPDPLEELAIRERSRAIRFAFVGIDEHEVDVGGHVELGAPELAHADDDQLLRSPARIARLAVHGRERAMMRGDGRAHRAVGEPRDRTAHLGEIRAPGQVPHERVQHDALAQPAQTCGERVAIGSDELRELRVRVVPAHRVVDRGRKALRLVGMTFQHSRGVAAEPQRVCVVHDRSITRKPHAIGADRARETTGARPGMHDRSATMQADPPIMPAARALLRAPSAVVRAMWRIASAAALVLFIAVGVFAALLLLVRLVVFPHIERYRDTITAAISREVSQPVDIDVLSTGWDGWNPKLVIEGVRIGPHPAPGAPALLELPRVDVTISWTSLPLLELTVDQLVFDKPRLSIRRDASGVIHLAGLEIDPTQGTDDSGVSDWLLRQHRIVVRDALITWTDESRNAPQLVLDDVDFRLERSFGRRYFGLRGNPPPEIAAPIDIRGELGRGSLHGIAQAEGRLYVRLDYADVSAWKEWLPLPLDVASGKGALRAWFTFAHGEAREVVADLELADVRMRLAPALPELVLPRLAGRAGWRVAGTHHDFYTRQLAFATASGAVFEPANLALAVDVGEDRRARGGRLVFDRVQLKPLRELAAQLPLPGAVREQLQAYGPTGTLTGGDVQWTGTVEAPEKLELATDFRDLAFRPNGAVPGATGLAGSLKASKGGGELKLFARDATVSLPHDFAQPIALAAAQGDITWTQAGANTDVRIGRLEFSNADAAGHLSGKYHHGGAGPGAVDIDAQLTRAAVQAVPRYLPMHLPQAAREWVARAVSGATVDSVTLKLKGSLAAFPFADGNAGTFTVDVAGKGLGLDYAEGWPAIADIEAGVHFRNAGVTVDGSRARVYGIQLANITATIPDLRSPVLGVTGVATGATRDFLRFIQASPVNRWSGEFAAGAEAQGDGRLDLKLTLPLHDLPSSSVAGEYAFTANQLKLAGVPALTQLNGRVAFTERDLRGQDITAQAMGGPVRFALTSADGRIHLAGSGSSPIAAIAREWPVPLVDHVTGTADWTLALDVADDALTWAVESPLKGVALDLPAPLRKPAGDTLPMRIERRPLPQRAPGDTIRVALGDVAQIAVRRAPSNGALQADRVLVSLGSASTLPDARRADRPGLWVRADVPAIDIDEWLKVQRQRGCACERQRRFAATI